jgi:hypothetical protein
MLVSYIALIYKTLRVASSLEHYDFLINTWRKESTVFLWRMLDTVPLSPVNKLESFTIVM